MELRSRPKRISSPNKKKSIKPKRSLTISEKRQRYERIDNEIAHVQQIFGLEEVINKIIGLGNYYKKWELNRRNGEYVKDDGTLFTFPFPEHEKKILLFDAREEGDTGHYKVLRYSKKDKKTGRHNRIEEDESYRRGYQKQNSQGLCMVFAMMIFLEETSELEGKNRIGCTRIALEWIRNKLKNTFNNKKQLAFFDDFKQRNQKYTVLQVINLIKKFLNDEDIISAITTEEYYTTIKGF